MGRVTAASPVVVDCIYGHEAGQSTTAILQAKSIDATSLAGGIETWKAAELRVQQKEPQP